MSIKQLAQAVITNYDAGMSGGDDKQFQALIDLGDQAAGIVKLTEDVETLWRRLEIATTALCDLHKGYPPGELAAENGKGIKPLLRELVTELRRRGSCDEGAWDTEFTTGIPVKL